jgi:hypothetical protein
MKKFLILLFALLFIACSKSEVIMTFDNRDNAEEPYTPIQKKDTIDKKHIIRFDVHITDWVITDTINID